MKNTFKSQGKTYTIKQTGTETKRIRTHVDFNGYEIEARVEKRPKIEVFDGDEKVGKVKSGNQVWIGNKRVGHIN